MIVVITVDFFSKSIYRFEHRSIEWVHPPSRAPLLLQGGERETAEIVSFLWSRRSPDFWTSHSGFMSSNRFFLQRTHYFVQVNRRSKLSRCQRVRALVVRMWLQCKRHICKVSVYVFQHFSFAVKIEVSLLVLKYQIFKICTCKTVYTIWILKDIGQQAAYVNKMAVYARPRFQKEAKEKRK